MARRSTKNRPVTFHPPFHNSGYFVLDSLGMVLCQFMPTEFIRVNGETHETAKWVVDALNGHAAKGANALAVGGVVEATRHKPGNAAAMLEACENIAGYAETARCHTDDAHILGYLEQIEKWARAALAAPPRQCDVGTVEEQAERFAKYCDRFHRCNGCPCCGKMKYNRCEFIWAQTPYSAEEVGAQ